MQELRKDYILDRWVIIASVRSKRPKEFEKKEKITESKLCVFCPGNESLTPPEIGRIEKNNEWSIRWFSNRFPFVEQKGSIKPKTKSRFFTSAAGYGKHEVIVDANKHTSQLWDTSKEHIKALLEVLNQRILSLHKLKNIKYVLVFKNNGIDGGTSIIHSHMQVVAIPSIPPIIKEKLSAVLKYKKCPYCDIVKIEKNGKRKCFENKTFSSFTPYASRFNYEIWVFPKKHIKSLNELGQNEIEDLADILKKILLKLKYMNISYNLCFYYSPTKENLHFHIEIIPRKATWAGFEFSSGVVVNSIPPEMAARFYRNSKTIIDKLK